jgi:hypothetical protein
VQPKVDTSRFQLQTIGFIVADLSGKRRSIRAGFHTRGRNTHRKVNLAARLSQSRLGALEQRQLGLDLCRRCWGSPCAISIYAVTLTMCFGDGTTAVGRKELVKERYLSPEQIASVIQRRVLRDFSHNIYTPDMISKVHIQECDKDT